MAENCSITIELPETGPAIARMIQAELSRINISAEQAIRLIQKEQRDRTSALERAAAAAEAAIVSSTSRGTPRTSTKGRMKQGKTNSRRRTSADSRRRGISRLLNEQGRPMAASEIHRTLNIPINSVRNTLTELMSSGFVRRVGEGFETKYEAKNSLTPLTDRPISHTAGTLQGRVLKMIQDRESVQLEHLMEAVGAPMEEVQRACGALIREGEIRMNSVNRKRIYQLERSSSVEHDA